MKKNKARGSMAFNIIGAIVLLLALLGFIISTLGLAGFTRIYKEKMADSTYHMADTATTLVNGDHLDAYLAGEELEEYEQTRVYLDEYCQRMSVSLIYIIQVDQSDYGRFISIFNVVNNSVDDTEYTPWELGHFRDTTNDEYRQKYKLSQTFNKAGRQLSRFYASYFLSFLLSSHPPGLTGNM